MKGTLLFSAGICVAASMAFTYGERSASGPSLETPVQPVSFVRPTSTPTVVPVASAPAAPVNAPRIALQAGHWLAAEAPDELAGIRSNGTRGGGKVEWEVNLEIARLAAAILEEAGYIVEVLPATVPPSYRADLFIAIHADGHNDTSINGFRVAARGRDRTGRANEFAGLLASKYREATNLKQISVVTRRMTNYYAFNDRRFVHSIHPQTVGVILETGFLTSASDRRIIVDRPEQSARGIVEAVQLFVAPPPPPPEPEAEAPLAE